MYLLPRVSQFHLGSVATIYESKLRTLRNTNKIPSIFSNTCQLNHKFKIKKEIKPLPSLQPQKLKKKCYRVIAIGVRGGEKEEGREKENK